MQLSRPTVALCLLAPVLAGQPPWPDFRGPDRQGHAANAQLPLHWNEDENVRFKTAIPGTGWSSPVVDAQRAWLTTATESGRKLWLCGIDLETGALDLQLLLFEVEKPEPKNALNSYASPSPVVDGERVYAHFGSYGTACVDAATGAEVWRREDIHCDHMEGPGSSPVLVDDLLVVHMDGGDVQYVIALDRSSGATRWKAERSQEVDHLPKDLRKAYSTPILVDVNGRPQLISSAAQATVGLDPGTGEELWKVRHKGFSMSSRPVSGDDVVFLNTGFMKPRLLAVRLGGEGDITNSHVLWESRRNQTTMPSPVFAGGRLYTVSDTGIATCIDAATGDRIWYKRLGGPHCASVLHAAGRLYFFDREGTAVVVAPGDEYQELARNRLDAGCMASPAVVGRSLVVRTRTHLYRLEADA